MSKKTLLRIRLRSFDNKLLDQATQDIMKRIKSDEEENERVRGPFPLPTTINKWTVLRGPHVNKKSREQFERRTHHRLIDIIDPEKAEMEALRNLTLHSGIFVNIKFV